MTVRNARNPLTQRSKDDFENIPSYQQRIEASRPGCLSAAVGRACFQGSWLGQGQLLILEGLTAARTGAAASTEAEIQSSLLIIPYRFCSSIPPSLVVTVFDYDGVLHLDCPKMVASSVAPVAHTSCRRLFRFQAVTCEFEHICTSSRVCRPTIVT